MSLSLAARRLVSSSITVARRANGSHLHRMDGYSLLEQAFKPGSAVISDAFSVGGRKWQLLLYPNGIDVDHRGSVSADLKLAYDDNHWAPTATYRVSILDYARNPAHSRTVGPCRFGDQGRSLSLSWMMDKKYEAEELMRKTSVNELVAVEELRRSAPFLLRNDHLNVLCDVSVVETKTETEMETEVKMETDTKRRNKWFGLWDSTAPSKAPVISQ